MDSNPWTSVKHTQMNQTRLIGFMFRDQSGRNIMSLLNHRQTVKQRRHKVILQLRTHTGQFYTRDKIMIFFLFMIFFWDFEIRNFPYDWNDPFSLCLLPGPIHPFPRTKCTDKTRHDFKASLGFKLCTGHTVSGFEVNPRNAKLKNKQAKDSRVNHVRMKWK